MFQKGSVPISIVAKVYGKDATWVSRYTHQQYGKELCAECAQKLKEKQDAQKAPDPFK